MLTGSKDGHINVNVHADVAPATLDAIGEGVSIEQLCVESLRSPYFPSCL